MLFDPAFNEPRRRPESFLLLAVFGLMLVGATFIYSATMANESVTQLPWHRQLWVRQIVWYVGGLGLAGLVCLIDYHSLSRWSMVGYWGMILLLILVLIPGIGKTVYGSRRWFDLGFFQLQPSEFAKLAFIFAQAHILSDHPADLRSPGVFWKSIGMTLLPFVLIFKEPDLGSALILLPVGLVMMYVAGVPRRYLARLLGASALLVAVIVVDVLYAPMGWQLPLQEYQRQRILVYFGKDFAPANATPEQRQRARSLQRAKSYNIEQALISVGSGGLTGKGWRQGTQNNLGFLPRAVAHNDFIFSVIAEEKGFVGSVLILTLYVVILLRGIQIAGEARDRLGQLLAVGVVALLFSHVFVNIGMNIRMMPVTGVPLPLLSYGGSSVVCSMIALGVLQNVYLHRRGY